MTCVVRVCKNGLQFPASNPAIEGMKVLMTRCSCIAALFLIAGCSYWGRRPVDELKPIDPDAPIWIWTKSGVEQWHWVEITQDSVSGIPWKLQVTEGYSCPMCRGSIPRTQVDSMKLGTRRGSNTSSIPYWVLPFSWGRVVTVTEGTS